MGFIDKGALKLQAVKVGDLKKKSAISAFTAEECASAISPDLSSSKVKSFSKFDGW